MPILFLSHATEDATVVTAFIQLIIESLIGIRSSDVIYTSQDETRVRAVQDWRKGLREGMRSCAYVLFFHSRNFELSRNCAIEIGWREEQDKPFFSLALGRRRDLPPEIERADAYALRAADSIIGFVEDMCKLLHTKLPPHTKINRNISEFIGKCTAWNESQRAPTLVAVLSAPATDDPISARSLLIGNNLYTDKRRVRFAMGERPVEGRRTRLGIGARDYYENRYARKDDLRRLLIEGGTSIPSKFLYSLEGGWEAWLAMTHDPENGYDFYLNSLKALEKYRKEIVELAIKETGDPEFDVVSLGCGDGRKDLKILNAMRSHLNAPGQMLFYFPLEISGQLINQAINTIWDDSYINGKLKTFGIQGDIAHLRRYKPYYELSRGNNFFIFLGNTIGNSSEHDMITALRVGMVAGDIILFEINTDTAGAKRHSTFAANKDKNWIRHTLPLKAIGIDPDVNNVKYIVLEQGQGGSQIPGTITVQGIYEQLCIRNIGDCNDVTISTVHHYDLGEFCETINACLGLVEIKRWEYEGIGYLLARKLGS